MVVLPISKVVYLYLGKFKNKRLDKHESINARLGATAS